MDEPRNSEMRLSTSKANFTENIFKDHKKKIEEQKLSNQIELSSSSPSINDISSSLIFILFTDLNEQWLYSQFKTEILFGEENPIIQSSQWSSTDLSSSSSYELRNLIFKSKQEIDYRIVNAHISLCVTLRGESQIWLVLHSNDKFDVTSAVISISKKEKSQTAFVSLGTFVKDVHNNLVYKVFTKQQLLCYDGKSNHYKKNDITNIKMEIVDTGEEVFNAKILVNDSKKDNKISSSFFLPVVKKYSVMIGGSGESCNVKNLYIETKYKKEFEEKTATLHKGCDCCVIF